MKSNKIPHKCLLCNRFDADKTNSHIIPSFIVCRTASSDGSGKRDQELVYSIGETIQAYLGSKVSSDVFERNFDDLSDERIENELKVNPLSKDYIFCSSCEKALAQYLESPYASGNSKDGELAYFFWASVIWRVNRFELLNCSIPKFILTEIRKSLDLYLQAKKNGAETETIYQRYPFKYYMLNCKGYSKDGNGCFYAEYDKSNRIYSIVLGDSIISVDFKCNELPDNYFFLSIQDEIKQAPINDGKKPEEARLVSEKVFKHAYREVLDKAKPLLLSKEVQMIFKFWRELINRHYPIPSLYPSTTFIQCCLKHIHDETKKLGERHTYYNFAISFAAALTEVYDIPISKV